MAKVEDMDIVERMVRALYLYPHYRVDSRGPAGCIYDVIKMVSPRIAKELDESDAATVYQKHWSER